MRESHHRVMAGQLRKKDAKLTEENIQESLRLKEIWDKVKDKPSQAIFGAHYQIGNQGMVWQCLNGKVPISLKAARGFAEGLGVEIEDFSPRLAQLAATNAQFAPKPPEPVGLVDLTSLRKNEAQIVMLFRALSPSHQAELMRIASSFYSEDHPTPVEDHSSNSEPAPGGGGPQVPRSKLKKAA